MNAERLLTLARFLREKVPDKCWNFGEIIKIGEKQPLEALSAGGGCGTVGCAVGWSPAAFPDELKWNGSCVSLIGERSNDSFATAEEFFDIGGDESQYLFVPQHYTTGTQTTPVEVAERIEEFVKTGEVFLMPDYDEYDYDFEDEDYEDEDYDDDNDDL